MKRSILMLSLAAGLSASVPLVYEANPDLFHEIAGAFLRTVAPDASETPMIAAAVVGPTEPRQLTGRRVEVTMGPRGHFSAEFKLNGRRIEAMIDTGATYVAMNRSTARSIGLNLSNADFRYSVNTANGTAKAAGARIDSLQIGRIHVENVDALVLEDRSLGSTLIGMSFLKRLGRFRVEGETLLLEQ